MVAPPVDPDDQLSEAVSLGAISTTPVSVSAGITPDTDVDTYRFTVTAGQVVDFDIDTSTNGAAGLNSYLRLFDSQGQELASTDNEAAPGESLGFDARDSDFVLRIAWPLFVLNVLTDFVAEDASYLSSFRTGEVWHVPVPTLSDEVRLSGPSMSTVPGVMVVFSASKPFFGSPLSTGRTFTVFSTVGSTVSRTRAGFTGSR